MPCHCPLSADCWFRGKLLVLLAMALVVVMVLCGEVCVCGGGGVLQMKQEAQVRAELCGEHGCGRLFLPR